MTYPGNDWDIAVTGMACRFPGANDAAEYWHNLVNGVESVQELASVAADRHTVPFAAPLNADVFGFDAEFFGIRSREAALMDPQHRMFLECAWHAMESAGLLPEDLKHAGLFAGCSNSAYLPEVLQSELMQRFQPSAFELQIANDKDYLVSRAAWHLGIEGPVMGIQAACATALVAVVQAVDALRSGRCDVALAGACTLRLPQRAAYQIQTGMIYSRDGHCRPFSRDASGTVFGSGVALVVLRPLAMARAGGWPVLAVIKGCAVNNDGAQKVGFTSTSSAGQRRLLAHAMRDAGMVPRHMRAMEAHGTGTIAGDPIEFDALRRLFSADDVAGGSCALGAVKANVGHLETCAGMAGLIKAVLEIQHGWICPQINIAEVNPSISMQDGPFYFPAAAEAWPADDSRRAIGVSAFGIGGTNAHIVLARDGDHACAAASSATGYPPLIPVSAGSEAAGRRLLRLYPELLATMPVRDVAWSAQTTRRPMRYRSVLRLDVQGRWHARESISDSGRHPPAIVFQFPGQGSQFDAMAIRLSQSQQHFARLLRQYAELLQDLAGVDIHRLLDADYHRLEVNDTAWTQPALVAVQLALARFLMFHDIVPAAVLGHSLGELAAACIAGRLSEQDALQFAVHRGRLMAELEEGAMLAVAMGEQACQQWLVPEVSVAAINADGACVLSGNPQAIGRLQTQLRTKGIRCRALSVTRAFHSAMMDPILAELAKLAPKAQATPSGIRLYSSLLGTEVAPELPLGADYWVRHARQPVRYGAACKALATRSGAVLFEVGPGTTLTALSMAARPADTSIQTLAGRGDTVDGVDYWYQALEKAWLAGIRFDWRPSWAEQGSRLSLPCYPFESQRHAMAGLRGEAPAPTIRREEGEALPSRQAHATVEAAASELWQIATGLSPAASTGSSAEAAADSLVAIQLVLLAERELGVELALSDILQAPSYGGFYDCLVRAGATRNLDSHS